jgi:hypothetical protein
MGASNLERDNLARRAGPPVWLGRWFGRRHRRRPDGHDHGGIRLFLDIPEGWNNAAQEGTGLLPHAELIEREQRIPVRGLVDPASTAFANVALGYVGVDRPGHRADVLEFLRRSRADFECHDKPFLPRR